MQSPIVPGAGANWPDQHSAEGNLDLQGVPVQVSRPSDYNPSIAATLGPKQPNANLNLAAVELTGGLSGGDRIFVGGIPQNLTESQIRDLLEAFGPLWIFELVRDIQTGNSKGYAYCVYQDVSATDIACAALNGMKIHHKTLTVRHLEPQPVQENELLREQHQIALKRLMLPPGAVATKIVCVTHMVSADELKDDREYEGILEGMRQEGRKFGTLMNVVIPRPNPNGKPSPGVGEKFFQIYMNFAGKLVNAFILRPNPDGEPSPGVGKVFLEYADVESAAKALTNLNGRKIDGNSVEAIFYPENKFSQGEYDG